MLCCMLLPTESAAQLVVKENFIFSLNGPVYSVEQSNAFYSNVTGNAALHFVGTQQTLAIAKNVYLTNVSIGNAAQLRIITKISIKENLDILSGVLVLEYPLIIGGRLTLLDTAAIENTQLITILNHTVLEQTNGLLANSASARPFANNLDNEQTALNAFKNTKERRLLWYVAHSYQWDIAAPNTPPPEYS
jgi:hypothetical protein